MNITEFSSLLPALLKHKLVPYLHGSQGLGKTSVMSQYAASQGISYVPLYMANLEPGDFLGLLIRDGESVRHARPNWFPTEGRGIIFLDELNRAHPDVKQALFSFILEGRIHTHVLPEGWSIVAAGNYDSDSFITTAFDDDAWLSRFVHIDFKPTANEFFTYAESKGANEVVEFLREQPSFLDSNSTASFDFNKLKFDRRRWLQFVQPFSNVEMADSLRFELYQGLIGTTAAAAYQSWRKNQTTAIKIEKLLDMDLSTHKRFHALLEAPEVRLDLINGPFVELVERLKTKPAYLTAARVKALKEILLQAPLEVGHKLFKDLQDLKFTNKNAILNDVDFVTSVALKAKEEKLKISIK